MDVNRITINRAERPHGASAMDCEVTRELNRHLSNEDRRAALADAVEERADELLADEQFLWDWLGDIGTDLRDQAVRGIIRAVMAEMNRNPALAHRYRRLALKEAEAQLKEEITC